MLQESHMMAKPTSWLNLIGWLINLIKNNNNLSIEIHLSVHVTSSVPLQNKYKVTGGIHIEKQLRQYACLQTSRLKRK